MVRWRFLPIFLLIYHHCTSPSDKTSNLGIGLHSFYTISLSQKFFCIWRILQSEASWYGMIDMPKYALVKSTVRVLLQPLSPYFQMQDQTKLQLGPTFEREFWTICFHRHSIKNTNKMLFDNRQKKKVFWGHVTSPRWVSAKVEEKDSAEEGVLGSVLKNVLDLALPRTGEGRVERFYFQIKFSSWNCPLLFLSTAAHSLNIKGICVVQCTVVHCAVYSTVYTVYCTEEWGYQYQQLQHGKGGSW